MGSEDEPTTKSDSSTEQSSTKKEENKEFKVGQTIEYNGIDMKVDEVKFLHATDSSESIGSDEQFVAVKVTITNKEDENVDYNMFDFKLNADGNSTDFDSICGDDEIENHKLENGTLNKGATVSGWLIGKAKTDTKKLQMQYTGSLFNNESKIDVNLK